MTQSLQINVGQPEKDSERDSTLLVDAARESGLTPPQRLAIFDPELHGGEAMPGSLSIKRSFEEDAQNAGAASYLDSLREIRRLANL